MIRSHLLLLALASPAVADDLFQFTVPVKTAKAPSAAYLWLPPKAVQLRGIVVMGMTLAEREMVKDPILRKACADEQLAILFFKTGLGSVDLPAVLDDLAKASNYAELRNAPLFFVGHSAGGPQALDLAMKYADRCFGLMQYRGGHPMMQKEPLPPGITALMMIGQFDEFGGVMRDDAGRESWNKGWDSMHKFRKASAENLGSIVVEPGAGHFAWSEKNAEYFALFLKKAARARIPQWNPDAKEPVKCAKVEAKSGWLTGMLAKTPEAAGIAADAEYKGEKDAAAWHFDKEMAEANEAYHKGHFGKKDQFLMWKSATTLDAGVRHYFNEVKWIGDGQTFVVQFAFAPTYPKPTPDDKGPKWNTAGEPAGNSGGANSVRLVGGPLVPTWANALRIKFDALAPATDPGRATFLAEAAETAEYRHTELVGMMPRGFAGLKAGKDQSVSFELPTEMKIGDELELKAVSDSGLPVEYYVSHGPARIEKGKLVVADVPSRANFPLEVKVVAYQFGRGVEPFVRTAVPVERTIKLVK